MLTIPDTVVSSWDSGHSRHAPPTSPLKKQRVVDGCRSPTLAADFGLRALLGSVLAGRHGNSTPLNSTALLPVTDTRPRIEDSARERRRR